MVQRNGDSMDALVDLRKFDLFQKFSSEEIAALSSVVTTRTLSDQEFLFHEGDKGSSILFISSGKVQILKKHSGVDTSSIDSYEEVNLRGEGDILGEMAYLDDSVRSAAARAQGPVELVVLDRDALQGISQSAELEKKLVYQIALTIAHRLRRETDVVIESFQKERDVRERQYEFGQFFVYVLICYAIGMLINHVIYTRYPDLNIYNSLFAWSYLVALMVPGIFLVWKLKIPWERVGLTFSDWKQSMRDGVVASVAVVTVVFAAMGIGQMTGVVESRPLNFDILTKPQYLFHSYGQEFLARGLLQNSLKRFFDDSKGIRSVVISSFLFSLLHIHFGLSAVFLTFLSSIVLGLFYLRHQSLLGVTLLHWSMGVCAFVTGLL